MPRFSPMETASRHSCHAHPGINPRAWISCSPGGLREVMERQTHGRSCTCRNTPTPTQPTDTQLQSWVVLLRGAVKLFSFTLPGFCDSSAPSYLLSNEQLFLCTFLSVLGISLLLQGQRNWQSFFPLLLKSVLSAWFMVVVIHAFPSLHPEACSQKHNMDKWGIDDASPADVYSPLLNISYAQQTA